MDGLSDWRSRTRLLYGDAGASRIAGGHVLVAGLGAVGSFAVEALAREGVGRLTLVDFDVVEPSNVNRQLYALHSTAGQPKAMLAVERVHDINPRCVVEALPVRLDEANVADLLDRVRPDVVVDAIDDLPAKAALIDRSFRASIPVVSSMGAARRMDPTALAHGPIGEVRGCPLAKNLRRLLRRRLEEAGSPASSTDVLPVSALCCVYSTEPPLAPASDPAAAGPRAMGSTVCVTGGFGLLAANLAIRRLAGLS